MNKQIVEVELELTEDQLGTVPKSRDVYTKYIATKVSPEVAEAEAEGIVEDNTTGWTTFMEDEQGLYILIFPDKPNSGVRTELKKNGFRWAPSIGAWQSYRSTRANEAAQRIAQAY